MNGNKELVIGNYLIKTTMWVCISQIYAVCGNYWIHSLQTESGKIGPLFWEQAWNTSLEIIVSESYFKLMKTRSYNKGAFSTI